MKLSFLVTGKPLPCPKKWTASIVMSWWSHFAGGLSNKKYKYTTLWFRCNFYSVFKVTRAYQMLWDFRTPDVDVVADGLNFFEAGLQNVDLSRHFTLTIPAQHQKGWMQILKKCKHIIRIWITAIWLLLVHFLNGLLSHLTGLFYMVPMDPLCYCLQRQSCV